MDRGLRFAAKVAVGLLEARRRPGKSSDGDDDGDKTFDSALVLAIKVVMMVMTKVVTVRAGMMIALTRSYPGSLSCPGSPLASLLLRT